MIPKITKKSKHKISKLPEVKQKQRSFEVQSYLRILRQYKESSHIFIVLDARNPNSCRYLPYESSITDKLVFILNKIDLIPREVAIDWYYQLKEVAPTFAISATKSMDYFVNYIKSLQSTQILITGLANVGKRTIMKKLEEIEGLKIECETWTWVQSTPDLAILKAIEKIPPECDIIFGVQDIIQRCSIQSLMDVFNITFFSDPERLLTTINKHPRQAAKIFFDGLANGKWLFYTVPHCQSQNTKLSESEYQQFKVSKPYDAFESPMIMLGYGITNAMKPDVLNNLYQMITKNTEPSSS